MSDISNKRREVMEGMRSSNETALKFLRISAERSGLHPTDMRSLEFLANKEVATAGELSAFLGLTSGATTALINRLEKLEMIVRNADTHDKRIIHIRTNPHKALTPMLLMGRFIKKLEKFLEKYSESELDVIARWNADVDAAFKKSTEDLLKSK